MSGEGEPKRICTKDDASDGHTESPEAQSALTGLFFVTLVLFLKGDRCVQDGLQSTLPHQAQETKCNGQREKEYFENEI